MCGIVGYIGKKKALPILLHSLKTLEYRGYDSAGIAYRNNDKVEIIKSVGKIAFLEDKIDTDVDTTMGIGHTRWATHGGVTINNCHPHKVGDIVLVHNGIIENYIEIKDRLTKLGYSFVGETDSEILCGLIDYYYKENNHDMLKTLDVVRKEVIGSYACAVMINNDTDNLYVMRKDSPLIVGIGEDENFIASDVPAILKYTNKYIFLNDYEIALVSTSKVDVYKDLVKVEKTVNVFESDAEVIDKHGYSHYMLKEIHEQATLARNNILDTLDSIPDITKYNNIYIVACGSAYHAGLIGKYLFEKYLNKAVYVDIASEFR